MPYDVRDLTPAGWFVTLAASVASVAAVTAVAVSGITSPGGGAVIVKGLAVGTGVLVFFALGAACRMRGIPLCRELPPPDAAKWDSDRLRLAANGVLFVIVAVTLLMAFMGGTFLWTGIRHRLPFNFVLGAPFLVMAWIHARRGVRRLRVIDLGPRVELRGLLFRRSLAWSHVASLTIDRNQAACAISVTPRGAGPRHLLVSNREAIRTIVWLRGHPEYLAEAGLPLPDID